LIKLFRREYPASRLSLFEFPAAEPLLILRELVFYTKRLSSGLSSFLLKMEANRKFLNILLIRSFYWTMAVLTSTFTLTMILSASIISPTISFSCSTAAFCLAISSSSSSSPSCFLSTLSKLILSTIWPRSVSASKASCCSLVLILKKASTISLNRPKNYMQEYSEIMENLELRSSKRKDTASLASILEVRVDKTFLKLCLIFSTGQ
jgi:hypothetical protein